MARCVERICDKKGTEALRASFAEEELKSSAGRTILYRSHRYPCEKFPELLKMLYLAVDNYSDALAAKESNLTVLPETLMMKAFKYIKKAVKVVEPIGTEPLRTGIYVFAAFLASELKRYRDAQELLSPIEKRCPELTQEIQSVIRYVTDKMGKKNRVKE